MLTKEKIREATLEAVAEKIESLLCRGEMGIVW